MIAVPLPQSIRQTANLPNHQKRLRPSPLFSCHSRRAEPSVMRSITMYDQYSIHPLSRIIWFESAGIITWARWPNNWTCEASEWLRPIWRAGVGAGAGAGAGGGCWSLPCACADREEKQSAATKIKVAAATRIEHS